MQCHDHRNAMEPHFLPKKDMILPCPALPAAFLPFPDATGACNLGFGGGAGSSSENDSQTGSSFVTNSRQ